MSAAVCRSLFLAFPEGYGAMKDDSFNKLSGDQSRTVALSDD